MSKFNYQCRFCGFECSSSKERVKCLDCNKMGLIPVELVAKEKEEKKPAKKKNPRQAVFEGNKWTDDGKLCKEDRKLTKILNKIGSPSPRGNRQNTIRMKTCEKCNREFKAFTNLEYACSRCIQGIK